MEINQKHKSTKMKKYTNHPMNARAIALLVILFTGITSWGQTNIAGNSRTQSFDQGWKFLKDNPSDDSKPSFDDSSWRKLDLQHDWSI
mgnify:CR=1 FL=1